MKMTIIIYVCPWSNCGKRFESRKKLNEHYHEDMSKGGHRGQVR